MDPQEVTGDAPELCVRLAHQQRQLAPGGAERRPGPVQLHPGEIPGDAGAGDLGWRRGAGFHPLLEQRMEPRDGVRLGLQHVHPLLGAQHGGEGGCGLSQHLEARRLPLPARDTGAGAGRGHARLALAAQLDELADLERLLGEVEALVTV